MNLNLLTVAHIFCHRTGIGNGGEVDLPDNDESVVGRH